MSDEPRKHRDSSTVSGESHSGRNRVRRSSSGRSSSRRSESSRSRSSKRATSTSKRSSKKKLGRSLSRNLGKLTERIEKGFKSIWDGISSGILFIFSIVVPQSLRKKVDGVGKSKKAKKLGRQVGELSDKVEKKFTKGATGIFEALGLMGSILVPQLVRKRIVSVWKSISRQSSKFIKRLGKGLGSWAEKYLPAWLVNIIKRMSKRARQTRKSTSRFLVSWWKSRNFINLAWATPAILLALPLIALLALSAVNTNAEKILHYRAAKSEAFQIGDLKLVDLLSLRLKQLGFEVKESADYIQGRELAKSAGYSVAYEHMKKLAPLDDEVAGSQGAAPAQQSKASYAPAHIWIVNALLNGDLSVGTDEENSKLAERHIRCALSLDSSDPNTRFLEIKLAEKTGRTTIASNGMSVLQAKKALVEEGHRQFAVDLMRAFRKGRNFREARVYAAKYRDHVDRIAERKRSIGEWLGLIEAHFILGDERKAFSLASAAGSLLENAGEVDASDEGSQEAFKFLNRVLAAKLMTEIGELEADDPAVLDKLEELLLWRDRDHVEATKLLARKYVFDTRYADDREKTPADVIRTLETADRLSPSIPLIAGDFKAGLKDWQGAIDAYTYAVKIGDPTGTGYNNLGWIWANVPPQDLPKSGLAERGRLEKALGYVNEAIKQQADSEFFETRGQIQAKLENWKAARDDLERSLNGILPESAEKSAHVTLVRVYLKLNEPEKAEAHRRYSQ